MTRPNKQRYDFRWRRGDTTALLVLCVLAGALLAIRARDRGLSIVDGITVREARAASVAEKIDPNTATAASIRRLPGLGTTLTEAIIRYRREHDAPAFRNAEDLRKVRRIGPGTIRRIESFLQFPPRSE